MRTALYVALVTALSITAVFDVGCCPPPPQPSPPVHRHPPRRPAPRDRFRRTSDQESVDNASELPAVPGVTDGSSATATAPETAPEASEETGGDKASEPAPEEPVETPNLMGPSGGVTVSERWRLAPPKTLILTYRCDYCKFRDFERG